VCGFKSIKALEILRKHFRTSELVCGGAKEPRRWFEAVLEEAKVFNNAATGTRLPQQSEVQAAVLQ
jgi:hypothetical protein